MCNPNRSKLPFIAVISLSCLSLFTAFSTTSLWASPTHDAHWKTRQCRRRTYLSAEEPDSEESSCSSRRGFINSCAIAAAACGAIAVSPANSMPLQSADANNINIRSNYKTPIESPSSQTLAGEFKLTAFQESISGFVSGSAVSTVKTLVKYPLDTATVRLQMPNTLFTIKNLPALFTGSLDGITAPLVSNIPAGAIFFAVKDATKTALRESGLGLPKWVLTSLAVGAALPPYWAIRNPSEVVKTRLQVGAEGYYENMSTADAFQLALSSGNSTFDGVSELYQGFSENILYGFPADIIKFVAYDNLTGGKGKNGVSAVDGAMYGALSTAFAQLLTTPLDVVRNRIMAEVSNDESKDKADDLSYIDRFAKIAKEEGVAELFAGTTPRIAKAMLSGAIQFAAYEETKRKMSDFFLKRS
mmetsp:Transcript_31614/g.51542  ORF Transcript_31614/g.51542 Transcript_31614/m.51542 type:complete len:416 (-) Transcript_31614:28-1275(-)